MAAASMNWQGVAGGAVYPAHRDGAVLQGLTQHFQGVAGKIPAVRPKTAHRCGPGSPHRGAGSTRRPPWRRCPRCGAGYRRAALSKPAARRQQPGHRVDSAGLQRFLIGQRRQDARQALGQHALPVPGGPTSSELCPPAAAISSARRASAWPRIRPYRGQARYPLRQSRRGRPG